MRHVDILGPEPAPGFLDSSTFGFIKSIPLVPGCVRLHHRLLEDCSNTRHDVLITGMVAWAHRIPDHNLQYQTIVQLQAWGTREGGRKGGREAEGENS